MATDPVCEMAVDERGAEYATSFEGSTYYFCSRECRNEFDEDPRRYVGRLQEMEFAPPTYHEGSQPPKQKNQDPGPLR